MLIQIHGGGFHNRGAQLMLWTAAQRLRAMDPGVRCVVEAHNCSYQERAEYDLLTMWPSLSRPRRARYLMPCYSIASKAYPKTIEKEYGLVRRCDIDAFVDISGYAFGDKWPPITTYAAAARVKHFHRQGKPTIFLPQMFGPFENQERTEAFRPILEKADLLYAREQKSYDAIKGINKTNRKLGLAPDITIFCEPLPPAHPVEEPYACLVPNMRMQDKAAQTWGDDYVKAMIRAGERLQAKGVKPYIVIHDGKGEDIVLGNQIAEELKLEREQIYREENPRRIKGFLAGAEMTIGSRFHALVSSLSSGTPAIALGWAHKYEALMEDFGTPELCCKHTEGPDCALDPIERLLDPTTRAEIVGRVKASKAAMKPENDRMWNEVAQQLGLTPR